MIPGVTVVIPSIPPRAELLHRALASVHAQTHPVDSVVIAYDRQKLGAAQTRHRGLMQVQTEWTAFLDDDDEFLPHHIESVLAHAVGEEADYVYSWFDTVPFGCDPFPPQHFYAPYEPLAPVGTTITILVKTELAQSIGFDDGNRNPSNGGEDWQFQMKCQEAGAKISHLVARTWLWHHDSGNTSGLPTRW